MAKREQVYKCLAGEQNGPMLAGEFFVEAGLACQLTGNKDPKNAVKDAAVVLDLAYVALTADKHSSGKDCWGREDNGQRGYVNPLFADLEAVVNEGKPCTLSFDELATWRTETDLFVFALIDGPFQTLGSLVDFNQFLMDTVTKKSVVKKAVERVTEGILSLSLAAIDSGADGIILGEDIAYKQGLMVSPAILQEMFLPMIKEITQTVKKPTVFHSDGNLLQILPSLRETGIAGLHSMEEGAGMDFQKTREILGEKICLLGGFDLDNFYTLDEQALVDKVADYADMNERLGPIIFGSSAGILDDGLPVDKVKKVYKEIALQQIIK